MAIVRRSPKALAAALTLALGAGCSSVAVTSVPAGARVLIDGKDTGEVTPTTLGPELFSGMHSVSVAHDGYATPSAKAATKRFGVGRLISSILLPVPFLIVNLARGFYSMEPDNLEFALTPSTGAAVAAAAPAAAPTPASAPPPAPRVGDSPAL